MTRHSVSLILTLSIVIGSGITLLPVLFLLQIVCHDMPYLVMTSKMLKWNIVSVFGEITLRILTELLEQIVSDKCWSLHYSWRLTLRTGLKRLSESI